MLESSQTFISGVLPLVGVFLRLLDAGNKAGASGVFVGGFREQK